VQVLPDERERVPERLRAIASPERDLGDVAHLAGATADAFVHVGPASCGSLRIKVDSPRYEANRSVGVGDGAKTITDEKIRIDENQRGQGLRREIFGRQVENAVAMGFEQIQA
jgi:hypothetical protein